MDASVIRTDRAAPRAKAGIITSARSRAANRGFRGDQRVIEDEIDLSAEALAVLAEESLAALPEEGLAALPEDENERRPRPDVDDRSGDFASLGELRQLFREKDSALCKQLGNIFPAAGIDVSLPIDLILAGPGLVRSVALHPDRARIDSTLGGDDQLAGVFETLAGIAARLRAAVIQPEFGRAYRRDPRTAMALFGSVFSGTHSDIRFRYTDGELTTRFRTPGGKLVDWWLVDDSGDVSDIKPGV